MKALSGRRNNCFVNGLVTLIKLITVEGDCFNEVLTRYYCSQYDCLFVIQKEWRSILGKRKLLLFDRLVSCSIMYCVAAMYFITD